MPGALSVRKRHSREITVMSREHAQIGPDGSTDRQSVTVEMLFGDRKASTT